MTETPLPKLYGSKKEQAAIVGICERTVSKLIATGVFRAVKLGDRTLCDLEYNRGVLDALPQAKLTHTNPRREDAPPRTGRGRPRKVRPQHERDTIAEARAFLTT